MCGIAGFVDLKRRSGPDELRAIASRMADSLSHRGPDDQGVWIDAEAGVALGHTRLAIIDLSPAGAQPMISSCGRFVLSYNGEVYNAPELRAELRGGGASVSRSFRHRGDGRGLCRLGRAADHRAPDRHVRFRRVGSLHTYAHACARSPRHQAALLGPRQWQSGIRLGIEGLQDVPRLAGRDRPRRAVGVPPLRLCADAPEHLSGNPASSRRGRCSNAAKTARSSTRHIGRCPRSLRAARPRRSTLPTMPRRRCWNLCSPTPCAGAWSRTCRSACFCPAASIPRRLRRSCRQTARDPFAPSRSASASRPMTRQSMPSRSPHIWAPSTPSST